jgi:hypothetical protein
VSELDPTAVGTLVPFGVVTVTWYVELGVIPLGPHTVTPPEICVTLLVEKMALLLA